MQRVQLTWGVATHAGLRPENQDRCLAEPPVFAVADGMGGHAAGAEASAVAAACLAAIAEGPSVHVEVLRAALRRADDLIRRLTTEDGAPSGAGTTVAGLALMENGGTPYWAAFHIGDSRVYRWAPGAWERISTDHSVVQELVDDGTISPTEALSHPQRHVITRALGVGSPAEADFTVLPVASGERLLLCSDGLSGGLAEARLEELLAGDADAATAAETLVEAAVSAGASDNVSAIVVHVHDVASGPEGPAPEDLEEITVPRIPRESSDEALRTADAGTEG